MSHFEALFKTYQDLGLKTSVLVLVTRPRPRSELKTLHRLLIMPEFMRQDFDRAQHNSQ